MKVDFDPGFPQPEPEIVTLNDLAENEGYIKNWICAGPYSQPGKRAGDLHRTEFGPEKDFKLAFWRRVDRQYLMDKKIVDINLMIGGEEKVIYLQSQVAAEIDTTAKLLVGSDDGVKIWLNGETVHEFDGGRVLLIDQDEVDIHLRNGVNTLLVKVTQGIGEWAACVRIVPQKLP